MPAFYRFCISALGGGGGKTLLSLGLARALLDLGYGVKPYKKGPDYIDAKWLSLAAKNPATNLDLFFLGEEELKPFFEESFSRSHFFPNQEMIALMEGNRGIFDGLDEKGTCSTAQICRILDFPVFLAIDCTKVTRTVAAILQGILNFEQGLRIAGVILNKIASARHEAILRQSIEYYTDLPVVGTLPKMADNPLAERHMGLASSGEILEHKAESIIRSLAKHITRNIDIQTILRLTFKPQEKDVGSNAKEIILSDNLPSNRKARSSSIPERKPLVGYVDDAALWFYYPENLMAIAKAGGELVRLSLLDARDARRWENLDAIYLGGGFPEDYAAEIASGPGLGNLRLACLQGLPIYAECGGLIVLSRGLHKGNDFYELAGILPLTAHFHPRPQALGYVEAQVLNNNPFFPKGTILRGHEFHYSACVMDDNEQATFALGIMKGNGLTQKGVGEAANLGRGGFRGYDAIVRGNIWASYMHIFAPAAPVWAVNLVAAASARKRTK